jgi:hypothetical protein
MTRMETRDARLARAYARSYDLSNLDRPCMGRFMGDATEAERAEMNKRETYVKPAAAHPAPAGSYRPFWIIVVPVLGLLLAPAVTFLVMRSAGVL